MNTAFSPKRPYANAESHWNKMGMSYPSAESWGRMCPITAPL